MHKLTENLGFDVALTAANYATNDAANTAAAEVDIEDAQNVVLLVDAGTVGDAISVTLQGADESDGTFEDLTADDGDTATITLDAAGNGKVEVRAEELKRYLKIDISGIDETGGDDVVSAYVISGNYGTLPVA